MNINVKVKWFYDISKYIYNITDYVNLKAYYALYFIRREDKEHA